MMQNPQAAPGSSGRLKYADPRDLPSYPSSGLRPDGAAASAAASLGWANQKSVECWKPEKTSSASAAAVLAKDYKAAPVWQPDASSSDGARAALLAAGSARSAAAKTQLPKDPHQGWGNSAASQAFSANRSNTTAEPPQPTSSGSLEGRRSLAAAKGAMDVKRRRAASTPSSAPSTEARSPESLAASSALSGATLAHQASMRSKPSPEHPVGGASPVTVMTRNMFTSHPPVKPEVDEKESQDKLHASAVAMARQMYAHQQKAATTQNQESQNEESSAAPSKPYINLQDAAYKQAQERLAKLQDEHQKQRELNDYYGSSPPPARHRFSISNKLRRRSSSDGNIDDQQQSEKIRQQMSLFSNKLSEVDQKKRQDDRDALMAAAQRNVKARLQGMDEKVLRDTGKVNPSLSSEWELKAQQLAFASHESRNENKGKVDVGGGKFMDSTEVNAIATKRVQPVLDEIHEKAETERARVTELKMEEEAKKAEAEKQKARDRELKDIQKKIKEEERQEDKAKRAEEKVARAEKKKLEKEEKRKSKTDAIVTGPVDRDAGAEDKQKAAEDPVQSSEPAEQQSAPKLDTSAGQTTGQATGEDPATPTSGTSPTAKVKGWIKNRFSRGKSVGEADKKKGFIGGAAIRDSGLNHSSTSLNNRPTSMRDVALAGKSTERVPREERTGQDSRGVSPMSSQEGDERDLGIAPPKPIKDSGARNSSSPSRDSRFREMMDR